MPIQLQYLKIATLLVVSSVLLTATFSLDTYPVPKAANAQVELASTPADSKAVVRRYESPPMDAVNLYWVETEEGIIIIDAGRFLSQARYALQEIRTSSDKPIVGILITHPHTDHYGGLPIFVEAAGKDIPIYASQATYNDMKNDLQGFIKARNELHGNVFPDHKEIPLPNQIVKDGTTIRLGGLTFKVIELPENETLVTTLYYLSEQKALFTGDLVNVKTTPFLNDGNSGNWAAHLQLLQHYPNLETVHPGHGEPGPAKELLRSQLEYIETVRSLVGSALNSEGKVTPREKANILNEMKKRYPDYRTSLLLPGLLESGIDGIANELTRQSTDKRKQ